MKLTFYHQLLVSEREFSYVSNISLYVFLYIGRLDLGNAKHIYRFEPNPFVPALALQLSNLTRLASYLQSDAYREIYQNYYLNFDDNETKDKTKKMNKKNKHVSVKT